MARKYSQDSASRRKGEKFPNVEKEQFEPRLDGAIFNSKRGQLVGPIETQFGHYIFKVVKITPAFVPTLEQATEQIRETLRAKKL